MAKSISVTLAVARYLSLALTGFVFSCLLSGQAWANATCDIYPETISANDLQKYADLVRSPLPAKYARLLSNVAIVNGDATNDPGSRMLMPEVKLLAVPRIVVPRGFLRLNCKVLQIGAAVQANEFTDAGAFQTAVIDCVRRSSDYRGCMTSVVNVWADRIDAAHADDEEYQVYARLWAENSFQFLLSHEAAHILFKEVGSELLGRMDEESAADLQAGIAMASRVQEGLGQSPHYAVANLAIWSVLDPTIDWRGSTHPAFTCRLRTIEAIYRDVFPRLVRARFWSLAADEFEDMADEASEQTVAWPQFAPATQCPNVAPGQFGTLTRDLDRLLARMEALAPNGLDEDEENPVLIFDELAKLRLETPTANGLRVWSMTLLSPLLLTKAFDADEFEDFDTDDTKAVRAAMRKMLTVMRGIFARIEPVLKPEYLNSLEYGNLLINVEMMRGMKDLKYSPQNLRKVIRIAQLYAPGTGTVPYLQGVLAFTEGRCPDGTRYMQEAFALNPTLATEGAVEFAQPIDEKKCALLKRALSKGFFSLTNEELESVSESESEW